MGMMNPMMMNPMMSSMMMSNSISSTGNEFEYFNQKYNCEDCFHKSPVPVPYPMHIDPLPSKTLKPSFWTILKRNILGG